MGSQDAYPDSVQFKPEKINYRNVRIDSCKPAKMRATNNGPMALENPQFQVQDSRSFRIQKNFRKCPNPLNPGDLCQIYIDFCPTLSKKYETILTFSGSQQQILLQGLGVASDRY
jgi:hypothetical protein